MSKRLNICYLDWSSCKQIRQPRFALVEGGNVADRDGSDEAVLPADAGQDPAAHQSRVRGAGHRQHHTPLPGRGLRGVNTSAGQQLVIV